MAPTPSFISTPSLRSLSTTSAQVLVTTVYSAHRVAAANSALHGHTARTVFLRGANLSVRWSQHRRRRPRQQPTSTPPNVSNDHHVDSLSSSSSSSQPDVPPVTTMTSDSVVDKQQTSAPTTTGTDTFRLSEESMRLLREQVTHPLFVPSDVHDPSLRHALQVAQPSQPPYHFLGAAVPTDGDTADSIIPAASMLVAQHSNAAVQAARAAVLTLFPGITEPGGRLYPQYRSDACWRDLNSFARVAGYACAVAATSSTKTTTTAATNDQGEGDCIYSDKGFDVLAKVYAQLDVPLQAVIAGVHGLWAYYLSVALHDGEGDSAVEASVTQTKRDTCQHLDVAFSALVQRLRQLKS